MAKKFRMPKSLATCADKLFEIQLKRYELQQQVEDIKKIETQLREYLISRLPKNDSTGIQGKIALAYVEDIEKPKVSSWPKFYAWVSKNKAFDLLQRRISDTAVRDRMMLVRGKKIPGVKMESIPVLRVGKAKGK